MQTRIQQSSQTAASRDRSTLVALDVLLSGVPSSSVGSALSAFSEIGVVYLYPPVAAVVQDEGEPVGVTTHHFRIHVALDEVAEALATMRAYRELVLPDASFVVEVCSVMVVAL
jgi:hypothetical protein